VVNDIVNAANTEQGYRYNFLCSWLKQEEKKSSGFGEEIAKLKATSVVVESALLWSQAAASSKDETFIVSDATCGDEDEKMYRLLEHHASLPTGIGISSEMLEKKNLWRFENLYGVSNRFARYARIHWTAITVLSGDEKKNIDFAKTYTDWVSTTRGEAEQADYVEQMYRVLFSNPNVVSISWRDLSDKWSWLGAPGGLLRRNGSPKPAYIKLMKLIHGEWWTNASGTTKADGSFATPAFFGDYQITVNDGKGHSTRQLLEFRTSGDVIINL
jgi:hypothetical protein